MWITKAIIIPCCNNDTLTFITDDNGMITEKIPKGHFGFKVKSVNGYINVYEKYDMLHLTIVIGTDLVPPIIITSKRKLEEHEIMMIGNDIIYDTNTSGLIEGKDYTYVFQL